MHARDVDTPNLGHQQAAKKPDRLGSGGKEKNENSSGSLALRAYSSGLRRLSSLTLCPVEGLSNTRTSPSSELPSQAQSLQLTETLPPLMYWPAAALNKPASASANLRRCTPGRCGICDPRCLGSRPRFLFFVAESIPSFQPEAGDACVCDGRRPVCAMAEDRLW